LSAVVLRKIWSIALRTLACPKTALIPEKQEGIGRPRRIPPAWTALSDFKGW
jgi:hypothetical protein